MLIMVTMMINDHGDEGDQSDVILFDSVTLTDNKLRSEAGNAQII